jgi:hypothetical protein
MKMGTEDKNKVRWLIGLLVVAGGAFYFNVLSDSSPSPSPATQPKSVISERNSTADLSPADPAASARTALPVSTPRNAPRSRSEEFRPAFRSKKPEDRIDPHKIDPTLRTDLLAKVQEDKSEIGARNLFQFGAAPPPPTQPKGPEPIVKVAKAFIYPQPAAPPPPPPPPPQPAPEPPIDVKYYGMAAKKIDGKKTAFFLDGEAIIMAPEGGIVKKKYRVVRIGLTSVLMENVENQKQQSLPLSEDAGANMGN